MKKPAPSKRSRNNAQGKGKSKTRRLDMSNFTPYKAKMPSNLWALLPTTKTTSTLTIKATTRTSHLKINTTTDPMMASTCKTCERRGPSCPFCVQSAPHLSPVESDWSDEVLGGDKQREKKEETRTASPTEGRPD